MAIPENRLSDPNVPGFYLSPDELEPLRDLDYELGGIALNDPSAGLMYQVWQLRLEVDPDTNMGTTYISAANHPESVYYQESGISEISLTFDQNMNPVMAFVALGIAKLRWFDTSINAYTITALGAGNRSPKCSLDDKRRFNVAASDILLGYIRDDTLYYRQQRDRFTIEYWLADNVTQDLLRIGMGTGNRVLFAEGLYE